MCNAKKEVLIVYSRYPEPGAVKTRLIPAIGIEAATQLHCQMTEKTFSVAKELQNKRSLELELSYTGGNLAKMKKWLASEVSYKNQGDGDLGQRMHRSFEDKFNKGYARVVIIGSDCPDLSIEILDQAFNQLKEHDIVFGPAKDGGYYLVGLTQVIPELFQNIKWGSNKVLAQSLLETERLNYSFALLAELSDVDRFEDLKRLQLKAL